mmetsp:Transcript_6545/g.19251  ORF Transcript_6545/g.19251 Transcript_6545/m.19251 type:complete len:177 (+) Transcript_6545:131-661(+)|eukprot:CAMPEP_0119558464 /NCGR_PEP_ID=MMETSP1352-20130426/10808_1 /TAXON_ID=265584 /ORGANISM="Stauroneis constricta, Strain CCMP1120" /LENGTH=176 /DNA_ID=CAMNT_0007605835 /DNA_START=131 /DNA_END=664 /DNA_ORIENTATION=+
MIVDQLVERVSGHCYCGSVQFEVTIAPRDQIQFSEYCHCSSCRRAHAAPLFQGVCLPKRCIDITAGKEHVKSFRKENVEVARQFCGVCGTRLFNEFVSDSSTVALSPSDDAILGGDCSNADEEGKDEDVREEEYAVFFPSTLTDEDQANLPDRLQAKTHNHAGECVLDMALLQQLN